MSEEKTMRKTLQQIRFLIALAALFVSSLAGAGTMTYFHNDLAGSPVAATNASGQVIWKERYRPYGERLINSPASSDNEVWFTSRRQDVDTGLVYMGARYYDPVVGRFISTDPKQFDGQDGRTFNRYAYAANNPLSSLTLMVESLNSWPVRPTLSRETLRRCGSTWSWAE
jgi:RHS repeat-associated protein